MSSQTTTENRRELRATLDNLERIQDKVAADPAVSIDEFYRQSYNLSTRSQHRKHLIFREPEKTRERYGRNGFGQRLLAKTYD